MKVKVVVGMADGAGTRVVSGQVVDVDEAKGKAWIGHGLAEPVGSSTDGQSTAAKRTSKKTAKKTATRRAPKQATGGGEN